MATEIERKYLVDIELWNRDRARRNATGVRLRQGYLSTEPVVRVRMSDDHAWLTIKGPSAGISRDEFEYEIPVADARALLELCGPRVLDKTRFVVEFQGNKWDVDEFHDANQGLVTAEIELASPEGSFAVPPWVGAEVSADSRYSNSALARAPFTTW
jgi:CYTH domain-containing protein